MSHVTGIRGCCVLVKTNGGLRYCAQTAIVTDEKGRGYCYYHNPEAPRKFGEGYGWEEREREIREHQVRTAPVERLQVMIAETLGWATNEWMKEQYPGHDVPPGWYSPAMQLYAALPDWPTDIRAAMELHGSARMTLGSKRYARYLFALGDILTESHPGSASCWQALLEFFDAETICRAWLLAHLEPEGK